MLAYLPLIQRLLLEYMASRSKKSRFSFNFAGLGLMALSFVLLFMVVIFLLLSLQAFAAERYGEPAGWFLTAAALFLVACVLFLIGHFSRRKKGVVAKVRENTGDRMETLSHYFSEALAPIKEHPVAAVALAVMAGMAAAEKFTDRDKDDKEHGTDDKLLGLLQNFLKGK